MSNRGFAGKASLGDGPEPAVHHPRRTARHVPSPGQKGLFAAVAFLGVLGLAWAPAALAVTVAVAALGLQLAVMAHRWHIVGAGLRPAPPGPAAAGPAVLPCYTILVPLFREAAVLPSLIRALEAIDYPRDRLDIILVLEAADHDTRTVATRLAPAHFRLVVVPPGSPQTKPKALNHALPLAAGTFLVVYDGEDRPAPDQLRQALAGFAARPGLACVQARLNFWNRTENWLTRIFALEYALWFDLMLPGLDRLGAPFPLGGTSNHFRTQVLREAGGWDPFNVTEDADLGLRLFRLGHRVGLIPSTTYEEAPWQLGNWMRQRRRWMKGYLQTVLVHGRTVGPLWRRAGSAACLHALIVVGGTVALNLVNPVLLALGLAHPLVLAAGQDSHLPVPLVQLATAGNLAVGLSLVAMTAAAGRRRHWAGVARDALSVPAYWLLMSLATYWAVVDLIRHPFHWHKTDHGVTRLPADTPTPQAAE